MSFLDWTRNKLLAEKAVPAYTPRTEESSFSHVYAYRQCYEEIELINRAINMLVDDTSAIPVKVGDRQGPGAASVPLRKKTVERLLNEHPNPYQDVDSFKRSLLMDFFLEGNIFIYFDGAHIYQLPAMDVVVTADPKVYVSHYTYKGEQTYYPNEIIHIKDNTYRSLFRGSSRLEPCLGSMNLILQMREFQKNFFKNGAVPGLVLKTENTLNQRLKDKLTLEWSNKYRPTSGGKRPIILDGGLDIAPISNVSFKELDFQSAVQEHERKVVKALGIPPLLLDSGNNANLRPNHRLYYLETIMPIINKINSALSRFFGYDIYEDLTYIEALRPELRDQAAYLQSLVNGGILTANEARAELDKPPIPGHDDIRIPANIAGSAANPSEGGRPPTEDNNDN